MTVTEITIARHGEALINLQRLTSDGVCRGLTDKGRDQVRLLADRLAAEAERGEKFDAAYHSPRLRCAQSAEILSARLGITIVPCDELRNADHGSAGDPWDFERNAIGTIPPLAPFDPPNPDAEPWQHHLDRVGHALTDIARRHRGGRILIVGHAETNSAALGAFCHLPPGASTWCYAQASHTALTRWRHHTPAVPRSPETGAWVLLAHGDTRHLPHA